MTSSNYIRDLIGKDVVARRKKALRKAMWKGAATSAFHDIINALSAAFFWMILLGYVHDQISKHVPAPGYLTLILPAFFFNWILDGSNIRNNSYLERQAKVRKIKSLIENRLPKPE